MSRISEAVKRWRERTKLKVVEAMGGKCCICGYEKCFAALELHHVSPSEKEFSFGKVTANPKSWDKIVIELRKCILICSNCHKEVHQGFVEIPQNPPVFNEEYINAKNDIYSHVDADMMDGCPVCGKDKPVVYKTCSRKCACSLSGKIDWDKIDIVELKEQGKNNRDIGDMLDVSGAAVFKRLKKIGISSKYTIEKKRYCSKCNTEITKKSKSGLCSNCFNFMRRRVERPSKEQLEKEISEMSWLELGRKYCMSDNAIRKWAKSYGIIL